MNRKDRRISHAKARKAEVQPVVAYHEAGHAVARLLTAVPMGYRPEEAVTSIQINPGTKGKSFDGKMHLKSQAICMGPMVSKAFLDAISKAIDLRSGIDPQVVWEAFAVHGSDEDRTVSMRSRMLIDVMGAAAEARFSGKTDPMSIFSTYACEDDLLDFVRNCKVLGFSAERAAAAEASFLDHAWLLVGRPSVWSAIEAIAKRLRMTMSGRQVSLIAWPILAADEEAINLQLPSV